MHNNGKATSKFKIYERVFRASQLFAEESAAAAARIRRGNAVYVHCVCSICLFSFDYKFMRNCYVNKDISTEVTVSTAAAAAVMQEFQVIALKLCHIKKYKNKKKIALIFYFNFSPRHIFFHFRCCRSLFYCQPPLLCMLSLSKQKIFILAYGI